MTGWRFMLANALIYTAAWWLGVLLANQALVWMLLLLGLHFVLTPTKVADSRVMLFALFGFGLDIALVQLGVLEFSAFPWWLLLLWAHFVVTLSHCLVSIGKLPIWAQSLIGMAGGASSYVGGAELGGVQLPLGYWLSTLILAAIWGLLLPLFYALLPALSGTSEVRT